MPWHRRPRTSVGEPRDWRRDRAPVCAAHKSGYARTPLTTTAERWERQTGLAGCRALRLVLLPRNGPSGVRLSHPRDSTLLLDQAALDFPHTPSTALRNRRACGAWVPALTIDLCRRSASTWGTLGGKTEVAVQQARRFNTSTLSATSMLPHWCSLLNRNRRSCAA